MADDSLNMDLFSEENIKRMQRGRTEYEKSIENAVTSVTDDPIMSSIFSDTARTTLQEQCSNTSLIQKLIPSPHLNSKLYLLGTKHGFS